MGCGPRGSLEWATMAAQAIGIDPLAGQYRYYRQLQHMQLLKGFAEKLPLATASADVLSFFNSLDHVDDLAAALAEAARVLKPNGLLLILADVHPQPTLCEPSGFGWAFGQQLGPEWQLLNERRYSGSHFYKSLRKGKRCQGKPGETGILVLKVQRV